MNARMLRNRAIENRRNFESVHNVVSGGVYRCFFVLPSLTGSNLFSSIDNIWRSHFSLILDVVNRS